MTDNIQKYKVTLWRHLLIGSDMIFHLFLFIPLTVLSVWHFYKLEYVMALMILLPAFGLFYFLIAPVTLHFQYYNLERGRIIEFDKILLTLTISKKDKIETIKKNDIQKIIINSFDSQNSSRHKPTKKYEYFVLVLKDEKQITVTSLIVQYKKVKEMFDGITKEFISQSENYL